MSIKPQKIVKKCQMTIKKLSDLSSVHLIIDYFYLYIYIYIKSLSKKKDKRTTFMRHIPCEIRTYSILDVIP